MTFSAWVALAAFTLQIMLLVRFASSIFVYYRGARYGVWARRSLVSSMGIIYLPAVLLLLALPPLAWLVRMSCKSGWCPGNRLVERIDTHDLFFWLILWLVGLTSCCCCCFSGIVSMPLSLHALSQGCSGLACCCRCQRSSRNPESLEGRVRYLTGRFAPHAPRWQLVVWTRQLLLLIIVTLGTSDAGTLSEQAYRCASSQLQSCSLSC